MDTNIIQLCIQSGAVGLCFYLIYVNRKMSNGQLNKMIDVVQNNTIVLTKLGDKIDNYTAKK